MFNIVEASLYGPSRQWLGWQFTTGYKYGIGWQLVGRNPKNEKFVFFSWKMDFSKDLFLDIEL